MAKIAYRQKVPPKGLSWAKDTNAESPPVVGKLRDDWVLKPSYMEQGKRKIPMIGNLCVNAGPAKIVFLDWDDPILPNELAKLYKRFLGMTTAHGYQIPVQDPGEEITIQWLPKLQQAYRDYSDDQDKPLLETFAGDHYSLIPASVTCSKDRRKAGVRHPQPWEPCLDGKNHDFRVRLWNDPELPLASFDQAMRILL